MMYKALSALLFSCLLVSSCSLSKASNEIANKDFELSVDSIIINKIEAILNQHYSAGRCSGISIDSHYIDRYIESADYGPMWYGDTIDVNKKGYLVKFKYDKEDLLVDKSKIPYSSKDWHSDESIFISFDKSIAFRNYTCRFGGVPPNHGYAKRKIEIDDFVDSLYVVLQKTLN